MLPDILDRENIHRRLPIIFPEGAPHRNNTREPSVMRHCGRVWWYLGL